MHIPARAFLGLAMLLLLCSAAQAQSLQQRMGASTFQAAGLHKLSREELARLEAWLMQQPGASAPDTPMPARATPVPSEPRRRFLVQGEGPVHAHARGTIANWTRGTVFELDNGQKWQVMAGEAKLYRALESPSITIVPGLSGRWFLQIDADTDVAKPKVERIE